MGKLTGRGQKGGEWLKRSLGKTVHEGEYGVGFHKKPGYAETTRQVTLRSLTTFFLIASRLGNVGLPPKPAQGRCP